MASKLYVGGLPYSVTGGRLQELFSPHGTVESANVISDKFTGQSRGFGFVEMSSAGLRRRPGELEHTYRGKTIGSQRFAH
jgi:hypothetical protein